MKMMTADEFYELRDDRTRIAAPNIALATAKVALSIDEAASQIEGGQLTYLTLSNLISRWCRTAYLHPQAVDRMIEIMPGLSRELVISAAELMKLSDPFGSFEVVNRQADIHLHVGINPPQGAFPVAGDGWIARTGSQVELPKNPDNAIGCVLAACFGCAYAMRAALNLPTSPGVVFSGFNFRAGKNAESGPALTDMDTGKVLLVGCGAVGASIAYLLPFLPLKFSELLLIDGDIIDVSNLNRVPIFFAEDAFAAVEKTASVQTFLEFHGIASRVLQGRFNDAVKAGLVTRQCDLVIPAANEDGVHAAIQAQYPPLMIYGTTGSSWDAHLHRHIPLIEDCLACRFPSHRPPPKLNCAEGLLNDASPEAMEKPSIGVLPFLSLAAAALAAAEMLQLSSPDHLQAGNFGVLPFGAPEIRPIRTPRRGPPCTHCWNGDLWDSLAKSQKYAKLSRK